MSDGKGRQQVKLFNDGRDYVHDESRSDRPSIINDDLVQTVDHKICENRRFPISNLFLEFPNI